MPSKLLARCRKLLTIAGLLVAAAFAISVVRPAAALDDSSVQKAVQYIGMLRGREISGQEQSWLEKRWRGEAALSPDVIAAQVDDLAVKYETQQRTPDPLALAISRTNLLKNVFCTARHGSDPELQRLGDIMAPADIVLAADCALGLVVTESDVEGLVASHALTASVTGRSHDRAGDRAEIVELIETGFADGSPSEKAIIAEGEFRHAVLARFWSRIEGTTEQGAVIDALGGQTSTDVRTTARELENLATSKLGDVDYLARVGEARLSAGDAATYSEWLERIAGYRFSSRDRAWLQEAIVADFRENAEETLSQIADIRSLNTAYRASGDPSEKAAMLAGWEASLHCYLSTSGDPDDSRLAEVLFRRDPVTDADCDAGRIRRKSDTVLVEQGGQTLTEGDLQPGMRFASIMIGRSLLAEEEDVVREDGIEGFVADPGEWNQERQFYEAFLSAIDKHETDVFLAMDERKKLYDPIYCELKASNDRFADDYVEMFRRGGAIAFEDCAQPLVTTEEELEALVRFANFLAMANDTPPPSQAELQGLRESMMTKDMDSAESSMLALSEWWSLLTPEEKAAEVASIKKNGITAEADGATLAGFIEHRKRMLVVKNVRIRQCQEIAIMIEGFTALYGASLSPFGATAGSPSGIPGEQLGGLVSATNAAAALCQGMSG